MVSSKFVAKLAGVSQATVSRVINGSPNVRKETKEKVEKVMQELNYQPNLIARSLVMKRTKTIALISGDLQNPFFVETTKAIINLAAEKGYNTMVYFENIGDNNKIFELAKGYKVDGIILSSIHMDDPVFEQLEQSDIPYVMFNRRPNKGGNYVVLDNYAAGKMAMEHLIQLGHTRVGVISGPTIMSTFYERNEGSIDVLKERGIDFDLSMVKFIDTSSEQTEKAVINLLNMKNPPTAILCTTDSMALYAMDTILSLGMRIPDDISLMGIDDIGIASHHGIQLTTVAHNKYRMGELAVNHLIGMIENDYDSDNFGYKQIVLDPHLVVRRTTKRMT